MRMFSRLRLSLVRMAFLAAVLLVPCVIWGPQALGDALIHRDVPRPSDLIVVLGGDFWGPRVDVGAELRSLGYAPSVLISGPPYGEPPRPESDLAIDRLVHNGHPREFFSGFAHQETSTPTEVAALCGELQRRRARSILLVTDGYHSGRARLTFALLCPEVQVCSVPATDRAYRRERWWTRPEDRQVVTTEWRNIAGTLVLAPLAWLDRLLRTSFLTARRAAA